MIILILFTLVPELIINGTNSRENIIKADRIFGPKILKMLYISSKNHYLNFLHLGSSYQDKIIIKYFTDLP